MNTPRLATETKEAAAVIYEKYGSPRLELLFRSGAVMGHHGRQLLWG
jgi:hypothetical protein